MQLRSASLEMSGTDALAVSEGMRRSPASPANCTVTSKEVWAGAVGARTTAPRSASIVARSTCFKRGPSIALLRSSESS
jgi:hypothetical protein